MFCNITLDSNNWNLERKYPKRRPCVEGGKKRTAIRDRKKLGYYLRGCNIIISLLNAFDKKKKIKNKKKKKLRRQDTVGEILEGRGCVLRAEAVVCVRKCHSLR